MSDGADHIPPDDDATPQGLVPMLLRRLRVAPKHATFVVESAWLAAGLASKFAIQMGTLYYLTSNLGVEGVGVFFTLIGLLTCLIPFVGLGNYDLTIRQIARREDPRLVAGRAMRSTLASFACVLPLVLLLRPLLAGQLGWTPYLMVVVSELLVMRVTSNVQAVATGFRLHYVCAIVDFVLGMSRFAAVFVAARLGAGVDGTLMLYAFTTLPTAAFGWAWMVRRCGAPRWDTGPVFAGLADHLRMVAAQFGEMGAREGDKPMLNLLAGPAAVGIFGTAGKLFGIVLVPIDLLTQVFRPRVSQAWTDGEARGRHLSRVMCLGLIGTGVVSGAVLFAAAALLPYVLPRLADSEWGAARSVLMYLSLVPPIYGLQRAHVITNISRGRVGAYAGSVVAAAALSTTTLVAFAPLYGWHAACAALGLYLAASSLGMWLLARRADADADADAAPSDAAPSDADLAGVAAA